MFAVSPNGLSLFLTTKQNNSALANVITALISIKHLDWNSLQKKFGESAHEDVSMKILSTVALAVNKTVHS